jgi:hypothetical protein
MKRPGSSTRQRLPVVLGVVLRGLGRCAKAGALVALIFLPLPLVQPAWAANTATDEELLAALAVLRDAIRELRKTYIITPLIATVVVTIICGVSAVVFSRPSREIREFEQAVAEAEKKLEEAEQVATKAGHATENETKL